MTYPAGLVRTHRLFDGRTVTIRPIRSDDGDRVRHFLAATSEESRYMRFQKWVHSPSSTLVHFMTDIDYDRHMALVCAVERDGTEQLVGEARYVANPDGATCDLGILIDDAWRKSGIAGLLMEALIRAARERGFTWMEGLVLADNAAMLRFAHALGFDIEPMADDRTTVRIALRLAPPHARAARPQAASGAPS
jgi:acetyltransferase